jgi:pyridoxal 5'-phosphate synthase pdxT subunit
MKIGVLALQGAFREHEDKLRELGVQVQLVKTPEELGDVDAIVLPGGESTAMVLIAHRWGLIQPLKEFVRCGKPVWGTCAGMILLAEQVSGQKEDGQELIGGLDIAVDRNHYGRQISSFSTELITEIGKEFQEGGVFIRAPHILKVGDQVKVLASFKRDDLLIPCAVRQGNIMATAFHPELSKSTVWHKYFIEQIVLKK